MILHAEPADGMELRPQGGEPSWCVEPPAGNGGGEISNSSDRSRERTIDPGRVVTRNRQQATAGHEDYLKAPPTRPAPSDGGTSYEHPAGPRPCERDLTCRAEARRAKADV